MAISVSKGGGIVITMIFNIKIVRSAGNCENPANRRKFGSTLDAGSIKFQVAEPQNRFVIPVAPTAGS
jgi:hypothetical protein